MRHRHIVEGYEDSVAAVEDILDRGSVEDWGALARKVRENPHGEAARSLRIVLANTYIYGTTAIWRAFLERVERRHRQKPCPQCEPPLESPSTQQGDSA